MEYGRAITVDGKEVFVHDDWIGPTTVKLGETETANYPVSWREIDRLQVELKVESPSEEDNGGLVTYQLIQYRWFRNITLARGKISLSEGQEITKVVTHPKEKRLRAGFRVRHVRPQAENANG